MIYILDFILDLIYPNVCGFCGKINDNSLCEECKNKINGILKFKVEDIKDKYFEKHIYMSDYEGDFRNRILEYKFFDKAYMYKTFARIILNNEKICRIIESYDIITSVPIHRKRKSERGYNQSELIAKELAKKLDNIRYKKTLVKVKNNNRQSELKKHDREENVKNVYEIYNKEIINNKKVIIFDDIYTTGNTVNECSRVLKENRSKRNNNTYTCKILKWRNIWKN